MLNAEEQIEVLALVSSTKNLILSEQEKEKVTVKGAADYVTNVVVAVQEFLKRELAEQVLAGENGTLGSLRREELLELLADTP